MCQRRNPTMKREKIRLLISFLFGIVFLMSMVSATVTFLNPSSSGTVSGVQHWNVSVTLGSFDQIGNCSIYVSSPSTANSTATNVSFYSNVSANATTLNGTILSATTLNIQDSNDYSMYASCQNQSGQIQNTSTITSLRWDNTVPTAPTSIYPTTGLRNENGSLDFSSTVIGWNTTACRLYFVNGPNYNGVSQAVTHSANSCTLSLTNVPAQTYNFILGASDGTNETNSSQLTVHVDIPSSAGRSMTPQQVARAKTLAITGEGGIGGIPTWMIIVGIGIIVLIIIIKRK